MYVRVQHTPVTFFIFKICTYKYFFLLLLEISVRETPKQKKIPNGSELKMTN